MEYFFQRKLARAAILVMGLTMGACAQQPQHDTPAQQGNNAGAVPSAPDAESNMTPQNHNAPGNDIALLPQDDVLTAAPGLRFPVSDGFDDLTSTLWTNAEGKAVSGDDNVDQSVANDDSDDSIDQPVADDDSDDSVDQPVASDDTSDLWERIRRTFDLPDQKNARIEREVKWFGRHQAYLDRVSERAQPYLHYIVDQVQQRGMPSEIALLPVVESAFQPYAYSSGRAAGIWQFIPGTGRRYGLKLNWWYDGRRDIEASTQAALDYLQYLHDTFDGDWLLALAAYNSGEGTVQKAIRANLRRHKPTDYWSLRLPRETEQYVPRLLALRQIVADPEQQGISLKTIANEPYLTAVKIDSQLDLATAAKMAEMDLDELHRLNPGFNRWATAPGGPHRLLVPLDKAAIFATNVAELAPEDRVHWVRHRVRNGETLGEIAVHYHTTVKVLTDLNKIRGHLIHSGQHLIIPITSGSDPVHLAVQHKSIPREVTNAREKTVHTVTEGDSLWLLAQRYGTTVRQLSRWNGISTRKHLRVGQKIIVGLNKAVSDAADNATDIIPASLHMGAAAEEIAKPRKITYTVRRGDSLARISQRFRVTIQQVRKWNDIKKNQRIQPGQELTLYVPLTADSERG